MSTTTIPEIHYDPNPMSDSALVCYFKHGSQDYGLALHGGRVWINAAKSMNWVAGTPMHVRAPNPYDSRSKKRVRISRRGYGAEPDALGFATSGSRLMAATTFRMLAVVLEPAIQECPYLSGHRKLELMREAKAVIAFCHDFLGQVRNYKQSLARCKARTREAAGLSTSEPKLREGLLVRIVNPENYSYANAAPTGCFRVEKNGKTYALRGIDGAHRNMLLRRARGMLLAHAEAETVA